MEEKLYTAGEIAKIAGVSLRTIRFYDTKGLLKPITHSAAGYRYYNKDSLAILQRILMLKYLGFSLEQIERMIVAEEKEVLDMNAYLAQQKELLLQRKSHLEQLIATIDTAQSYKDDDKWSLLVRLLNLLTDDEKILEQYKNSANLDHRINLHNYSTSSQDWMHWVYERLNLMPNDTVLEIGCGNGLLWRKNIHNLPDGVKLILTDRSEGMLQQTRDNLAPFTEQLKERDICIEYQIMDANNLVLPTAQYDRVIANHMLYHVKQRKSCLQTIYHALKPEGLFLCATIGTGHMRELHDLVQEFDSQLSIPSDSITVGFKLENGEAQLREFFSNVKREDHENNLIVDDVDAIYNYVYSYPGNAPYILDKRGSEFRKKIQEKLDREGAMYIHKSTGVFICKKI